jgi:hypothetical protein
MCIAGMLLLNQVIKKNEEEIAAINKKAEEERKSINKKGK